MNKYTNPKICSLPTAAELRASLVATEGSGVRNQIASIFDANTFVEIGAYTKRGFSDFISTENSNEFEGVICGYGAIDGKLSFMFAEDVERMSGVIDEKHAKKIVDLYDLAISNGAPVIGIFNSNGTDVFGGTSALAAYGRIMKAVNHASGVIPQIAYVSGNCIGTASAIAAMYDFVVKSTGSSLYVSTPSLTGAEEAQEALVSFTADETSCASYIRALISFLPDNSSVGIQVSDACADNLNRMLGDINFSGESLVAISAIADNGLCYEVGSKATKEAATAFATIGGVKCGIVASAYSANEGRITAASARKIAKFVNFCDSFSIPVVTLVDSIGLAIDKNNEDTFAPELAKLACAYASASCPKVTVITGHAIGAAFVLMGSKSLGADIVYAIDDSQIGALNAESGVAFAWDKYITEEKSRDELIEEWRREVCSPVTAAASGEIDDIISINELRARICSALLMLASKGSYAVCKRKVLPL